MGADTVLELEHYGWMDDYRVRYFIEEECQRVFKDDDIEIVKSPTNHLYYIIDPQVFTLNSHMKSTKAKIELEEY